jgi:hypothetical protein
MSISLFVLALWVLLIAMSQLLLGWFNFDVRFLGYVGIAFVVFLLLETVWTHRSNWFKRPAN